jgi:hypothetical protein
MKKFVCAVWAMCTKVANLQKDAPNVKAPKEKFSEKIEGNMQWADEHKNWYIAQGS